MSIFVLFICAIFVQQIYHLFVFSKIAFYEVPELKPTVQLPVSIVICCKNEYHHLSKLLPLVITQSYPCFDIVIADDASTDDTALLIQRMSIDHPGIAINHITVNKTLPGKKEVLEAGVRASKHEWILVTDADCIPASNEWVSLMMQAMKDETEIVLGYAPFFTIKNNFINIIARFENFMTGCFYLSFALSRMPYMGVGRNMLYKKSIYVQNIERIKAIPTLSGDDDLLIQLAANAQNTTICMHPKSFLFSSSKATLKDFLQQKTRHIQTGFHYHIWHLIALIGYPLSLLILYLSYFGLLFKQDNEMVFATIVLSIYLLMTGYLKMKSTLKLGFTSRVPILVLDSFFLLYQIILVILPFNRNKKRW